MKNFVAVLFVMLSLNAFSQIPDYVPADGLVAWYPFDQNFQDESDFGNDAVENGSVRSLTIDFKMVNQLFPSLETETISFG